MKIKNYFETKEVGTNKVKTQFNPKIGGPSWRLDQFLTFHSQRPINQTTLFLSHTNKIVSNSAVIADARYVSSATLRHHILFVNHE